MSRWLHPSKEFLDARKNHGLTLVRAGECFHGIHRIKSEECDEFHFIAIVADEQLCSAIAFDVSRHNARKNLAAQHHFVVRRVGSFCPAMPDPRDHMSMFML